MPVRWIDPSLAENNKVKAEKDKYDVHFVINSSGLLAQFNQAEIIDAADVHLADRLAAKYGEKNEAVILAVALAARAVRHGSPAVDLAGTKQHYFDQLTNKLEVAWPGDDWYQQVKASHLVKAKAIRVLDQAEAHENATGIVYLNRYWHDEVLIADTIKQRLAVGTDSELTTDQNKFLQNLLPDPQAAGQIAAVKRALEQATTVITGGPGTGKTTTLGALLAMLAKFAPEMQVALAAPTGKAAKRMNEAILEALSRLAQPDVKVPKATTINRLLGPVAGSATRFQHNVSNPLPFDIIIIDEASHGFVNYDGSNNGSNPARNQIDFGGR